MTTLNLPSTLDEIKAFEPSVTHPRTYWDRFESFFASHGMTLWLAEPHCMMGPPDDNPRAPDAFSFWIENKDYPGEPFMAHFMHPLPVVCPARTKDGRDVVIRIVSVGEQGSNHRAALERLSTGNIASVVGNHAVPVLQWLSLEHITFAVLPMLSPSSPLDCYTYEDISDVLKSMIQMLEAIAFCHSRIVAHMDVFQSNFLCNYRGGPGPEFCWEHVTGKRAPPFRSTFPFMLYLIDFETSICFDEDSDPSTHLTKGFPLDMADEEYIRPKCPEMSSDASYNPFLADVWQLGTTFAEFRLNITALPVTVQSLIKRMVSQDPRDRPSAAAALDELRGIMESMSKGELRAYVPM